MMSLGSVAFLSLIFGATGHVKRPNIVFLVCESTDGRTYRPDSPVPLPNIQRLRDRGGVSFDTHYSNAPVCCPSRATFWSGRHAHNIPHDHNGVQVNGAWNNYEGLPLNFTSKISDLLNAQGYQAMATSHHSPHGIQHSGRPLLSPRSSGAHSDAKSGYEVQISGKKDWSVGAHSENVRLNAWTMYTRFPYDIPQHSGWYDENECVSNGTVSTGNKSMHQGDWDEAEKTTKWIRNEAPKMDKPFFAYQGMNIVHPPYVTNEFWYNKIDGDKINVPEWPKLDDPSLHPCDFASSMLKGCTPSDDTAAAFYSTARRKQIRRIYYAMIAEFDAMVGAYIDAVEAINQTDNTFFIVTSDHGDMNMEHQQFYKMVAYDASSRVPMTIAGPGITKGGWETRPTQLIDIFPTIMDMANVPREQWPSDLDGYSLAPMLGLGDENEHPGYVVSQFHGDNIAMSWFMITDGTMKLVQYGTGKEVPAQLFNVSADPEERTNLVDKAEYKSIMDDLDKQLRSVVDYPSVAVDVAKYGLTMFENWKEDLDNKGQDWKAEMGNKGLRWYDSWSVDTNASVAAVLDWASKPAEVLACRKNLTWSN